MIHIPKVSQILTQQIVSLFKKWWQDKYNQTPSIHLATNWSQTLNPNLMHSWNNMLWFAKDETSIGTTPLTEMTIDMGTSDLVSQKPYPIAMKNYQWVKDKVEKLLTAKVIHSSRSRWSATIIVVPKGDGGKWLVIDYCTFNKVTRKFTWPIPKVEDIFSKLNGAKYFSTLDLWAGYHHIPLDKPSIPKTAFNSPFGKYEYVKVPFGLAQAPAYFQELMTDILKEFDFAIACLDDIIIFSRMAEEHLSHIKQVFEKFRNAKLSMKFSECHFFTMEIQYLGHILSTKGIWPLPSKTQAIQTTNLPKTPKQVHAFLGLVGYYKKFIKDFTKIAKPLTLLTQQQVKFDWMPTHHEAFLKLKESTIEASILCFPDPNKRYIVYTDASDDACGAQLSQEHNGNSLLSSFHTPFQKHKENRKPPSRKLTEFIMPLPNVIINSRELIS